MKTRFWSFALTSLMISSGCGDAGTGPDESVSYFPLAVGNTWTFAPEDPFFGAPFEWRVTGRRGDTVTILRPPDGSHPGPVTLVDRVRKIDLLVDGPLPFYRFIPGSSWMHRDTWECDDASTWVVLEEPTPVTTPAGTFDNTLRIERHSPASCTDAGTMVEWWAPDVGLVRWEELNFYAGGPLAFELVAWSIAGG